MKKNILLGLVLITLCIFATGCGKKEENKKDWKVDIASKEITMDEKLLKVFNDATKDSSKKYEAIALLGTQVVAGTNYMFLAVEDNTSYKILVIYKNLEGKSSLVSTSDFDFTKYVNENFQLEATEEVGGWNVEVPEKAMTIPEKVQEAFDKASEKLVGATYLPIAVLGHLDEDGTKYAVLCFGTLATANADTGVFVVTLYDQSENTKEINSIAYVKLADFNK